VEGSDLYQRQIAGCEDELMHKVWDGTPWMVDAFTGSTSTDRYLEMVEWCREQFGPEAWPIHGKPGNWHTGGATVFRWTWMGFRDEEMMRLFETRWPVPEGEVKA